MQKKNAFQVSTWEAFLNMFFAEEGKQLIITTLELFNS